MGIWIKSEKLFARCYVYLKRIVGPEGQPVGVAQLDWPPVQATGVAQYKYWAE